METLKTYRAGNWLRGYYEGEFASMDEAWSFLSKRFLLSYPSEVGRHIFMQVQEKNAYGFEDFTTCKSDITEINDLDEKEVLSRCPQSHYRG